MKIRGSAVFEELRRSLEAIRADAARVHEEHKVLDERVESLVAQRGAALLELAKHYLPVISQESVENSFGEIRDDLQAILSRKERQAQELTGRLQRLREAEAASLARVEAATEQAHELHQHQEAAKTELTRQLAANPEFQQLSQETLAAEAELQRDEERVEEIRSETTKKLPAYEHSSLFRYLQRRQFGESNYGSRGFTRRLDRWLARLIDYPRAKRSYKFLQVTPGLMEAETARRREHFHRGMTRLEQIEAETSQSIGVQKSAAAADDAEKERQRLTQILDGDRERVRAVEQEVAELDQMQGRFYEEALARFRSFLAKTEVKVLESRAASTSERVDDEIVSRLRYLTDDLAELEPRVSRLMSDSKAADKRTEGMEFVVRRFEQANYHEERSFFNEGFDVATLIHQYRAGAVDRDALWTTLKQAQIRELTEFERRASEAAKNVMNSQTAGSLVEAMVQVAGAALTQSVGRSVNRRKFQNRDR